MSLCRHKRKRAIIIFLEPTDPDQLPCVVMRIQCHECGLPFEFVGIQIGPNVILSADRRELRLSITEATQCRIQ